ncbi:peptidoglycan editing factor PgeF [Heyndrickxia sp. NPDC080065]|uniref:peptidoglycan editing factor PgeF n=1 Tax=Heyndrickxia sp. NPDC080065 TaxID=3390568 RepID=UPI003CFD7C75
MIEPFQKKEEEFFIIEKWNNINSNIVAGFTTKNGGNSINDYYSLNCGFHVGDELSDVQNNRQQLADKLNFSIDNWVGAEQTHGIQIEKINEIHRGKGSLNYSSSFLHTDGLYTDKKNILLTLCFADCVPLYFFAPKLNMIGIAHAGWKGTVNGIAKEMIEKWKDEKIPLTEIHVVIGPSICKECYIVDNHVISKVNKWIDSTTNLPYKEITAGQYQLDLRKLNYTVLVKSGISPENISITKYCTSCDHNEFFSHRRDSGKTGRMLSFIGLKGD